jgi:hypothetical protein
VKLHAPFVQLPLQFDAGRLLAEVSALDPSCWREHPQKFPGNFALPLISVEGDPSSDAFAGPMRPTPSLMDCPYLMQVLDRLGAVWGRTRLMKLSGRASVNRHTDISYYWRDRVRVHVPIVTKPTVRFLCGEAEVNMAAGECWIFNTWLMHQVINGDDDERIHLVADTVGSEPFWALVDRGQAWGQAPSTGWQAASVEPTSAVRSALIYESVNLPEVMTPWELREHLMFLLADVRAHPQLAAVEQVVSRFITVWKSLWARYGIDQTGWPSYRIALNGFEEVMERATVPLRLSSGLPLMKGLRAMVLNAALADAR